MSRTLILMRHADAGIGYPDHERPLSSAGKADATSAGSWIRSELSGVDAVVCSTAKRTRQTLEALAVDAPTRFAEDVYGGGVADILDEIARTPDDAQTLLVVGHAPGIPAVAYELARLAEDVRPVPSAANEDPEEAADLAALRHFAACALAVLVTDSGWAELSDVGAELVSVRHPRD